VIHGYPVERNRLLAARSIQPTIPLAGLVPATHVFECGSIDGREGVDGRDKPGQGEPKVVPVSSAPLCSCSKKPNRTAVAVIRIGNSWAHLGLALVQIGAGVRLPFGCAAPVIIVLSLLLWAILLILLLRLLHDITGARGDMKRPA